MKSVWSDTSKLINFPKLKDSIKTNVLIIGGGMAGILCAYMLHKSGVDYVLAESNTICSGITKNTTAKITSQHGLLYDKLIREFGIEKSRMYLEANEKALNKYRSLCKDIDCDFETKDSFVYSLNNIPKIQNELTALNKIGVQPDFSDTPLLPFKTVGSVKFKNQAQFNPLKFISEISKGLNIYENTPIRELNETTAITDYGKITADKIIVATHFPFINKHGSYFLKMYQHRSYVLALKNAPNLDGMYLDEAENGMSFRNYNDLLLIGGGGHRPGKKGGNWQELSNFAKHYYPYSSPKYYWSTQDCMTLDKVPYIGQYSKRTPNFYVATGFNKWGMTSSMVSSMILSDMVTGKKNPYAEVFSPSRTILRAQLAINAFESITNLLTISNKRCPHLGCALKWNPHEHSWDCPCHGSRFTEKGVLIDNPATGNLKHLT